MASAPDRRVAGRAEEETWLLQSDAAAAAACSVSAIRKWRRSGLVADRTRLTAGGMSRVEVRLEDVLRRVEESMPGRRVAPMPAPMPAPAPADVQASAVVQAPAANVAAEPASAATVPPQSQFTPVAVISVTELDSFVALVGDAERRAAQAEARLQANGVMTEFLRDRVEDLQRQLDSRQPRTTQPPRAPRTTQPPREPRTTESDAAPQTSLQRLEEEIRRLRSYVARGGGGTTAGERATLRVSYDAALVCAGVCLGLRSPFRLGDPLTAGDRASLTEALAASGFTVT